MCGSGIMVIGLSLLVCSTGYNFYLDFLSWQNFFFLLGILSSNRKLLRYCSSKHAFMSCTKSVGGKGAKDNNGSTRCITLVLGEQKVQNLLHAQIVHDLRGKNV